MKKVNYLVLVAVLLFVSACKKKKEEQEIADFDVLKQEILADVSTHVIGATYSDLDEKAKVLYSNVSSFNSNSSPENLTAARQAWIDLRSAWEQSEGFLFGPVSIDNIDPRIDTWPIDFARIDSVISTSEPLTESYVDNLEEALKGFHPVEFILWGSNGSKTSANFQTREKELLMALATNLKQLCASVNTQWSGNYHSEFVKAGNGSTVYLSERAAYDELIDAIAGICDEVANGKLKDPFDAQDPMLEESPFAKNSMTDFRNNIKGVENIYLGNYKTNGKGLEDFIRAKNLSMDATVKAKIANAKQALNNVTMPFGEAISLQRTQLQNAMNAVNELKDYLEKDVKSFVQLHTKN